MGLVLILGQFSLSLTTISNYSLALCIKAVTFKLRNKAFLLLLLRSYLKKKKVCRCLEGAIQYGLRFFGGAKAGLRTHTED